MQSIKETDIQLAICDYLALRGHFFWRQNTTAIFDTKRGVYRSMPKYAMHGIPDIIVIKDGAFIGLEVKRTGGKASEHQAIFAQRCQRAGGSYNIVRSIEDVQALGL